MDKILSNISLSITDSSFLKNPDSSELGRKIVTGSIELIDDFGFEQFPPLENVVATQSPGQFRPRQRGRLLIVL